MTTALNRKFDFLVKSETCPPYLLDVLALLVAHANETELFKQELRSAPFEYAAPLVMSANGGVGVSVAPKKGMKEPKDVNHVGLCVERDVHDIAERALRSYAVDLKKINDIAMATSCKSLREMKTRTSTEMMLLRDRVVNDAVERTREELDSLRMGWLKSMNEEMERVKAEVHQVGLTAQKTMYKMLEGYSDFVSNGFKLLKTESLEATHRAMAECSYCVERLEFVERQIVPHVEIDRLCERLKNVERVISQMVNNSNNNNSNNDNNNNNNDNSVPPPATMRNVILSPAAVKPLATEGTLSNTVDPMRPLGMQLRDGGTEVEGLIVEEVVPNSPAARAHICPGYIISHVGTTLVTRRRDFTAAIRKTGAVVKLTVYDQNTAKVRILTLDSQLQ